MDKVQKGTTRTVAKAWDFFERHCKHLSVPVFQGSDGGEVENKTRKPRSGQIVESREWFAKETEISLINNRELWM